MNKVYIHSAISCIIIIAANIIIPIKNEQKLGLIIGYILFTLNINILYYLAKKLIETGEVKIRKTTYLVGALKIIILLVGIYIAIVMIKASAIFLFFGSLLSLFLVTGYIYIIEKN